MVKADWLSRVLGRAGVLPKEEAEEAIRQGRVTLGGRLVRQPMAMVRPGEVIRLDGHKVELQARTVALMFHKPRGSVTAPEDRQREPTVFDLLIPLLPLQLQTFQWHAVGRLDRNTTGLLLFTNDERLVEHVTAPASHLAKRYLATVSGQLDGPKEVELVLTEGRHHQVKRMLGALGLPVLTLHREAVGKLVLDLPEPGSWRELTPEELKGGLGFS
jgi:16S rRNA U516 pseudouridylate synthase RsuA-like enzyme